MKYKIYADNAATTQLDKEVLNKMIPWLLEEYGNASQSYSFARKPRKALAEARATIAECINALPEEIFFTSGGTESNNWVIKSAAYSDREQRETITSAFEHNAILHSCAAIERLGYHVKYVWPTMDGQIVPENLGRCITGTTRLVSVMYANNEIGSIQPIKELCEITHMHNALFHTDAVQAIGHIKIDVKDLDIDMLSASAHKFNGPKGIGFLYIKKGVGLQPFLDGGSQENGFRAGTENIASIIGMAAALKRNCDSIEENQKYLFTLEQRLLQNLDNADIKYTRNGGYSILPGLLSLSFAHADGEALLHRLDLLGISISTGSACNSRITEISHVLKAIKLDEVLAKGTVRISLGKNNTIEDVDIIAKEIIKILNSSYS